jgi:uncharacterized protein YvpB
MQRKQVLNTAKDIIHPRKKQTCMRTFQHSDTKRSGVISKHHVTKRKNYAVYFYAIIFFYVPRGKGIKERRQIILYCWI